MDTVPGHTGKGTLFMPANASVENPVPAMIILHGSGGIKEGREFEYAKLFADSGIAGFVVDYYSPRGITEETSYLHKTLSATEVDIIVDAYAALKLLGTHPVIDASRIGVTGYSYGGMATRYTLDSRLKAILAPNVDPIALHLDVYGPCHQTLGYTQTTGAPYMAIYGDQDNSVNPLACEKAQQQLREGGSEVTRLIIEGAGHAWETTTPRNTYPYPYIKDCSFTFEPKTGRSLVDGVAVNQPTDDMNRDQRAFVRASIGQAVSHCVGQGYIIGSDKETDLIAKKSHA